MKVFVPIIADFGSWRLVVDDRLQALIDVTFVRARHPI
jgi:hypothetical protein